MTSQLIIEFSGPEVAHYWAVNEQLGLDVRTGEGDWPEGLLHHSAGTADDGRLIVIEIWESREQQAAFMEDRLGAALQAGGVTDPPSSVTWIDLISDIDLEYDDEDEDEDEEDGEETGGEG